MRTLKKRLLGAVMTVAMVSVMSFSVLAAPSPTKDGVVEKAKATDKSGNAVEVQITEIPEEYKAVAKEIQNIEKVKEVLGNAFVEGMEVVDVREVTVPENTVFPVTITFDVPGVLENTNVAILHYVGNEWKVEKATAGKGTITATFESLSPIAFVVDKNTAASSATSPKTGESAAVPVVGAIVIIAAAGAFALRRKAFVK